MSDCDLICQLMVAGHVDEGTKEPCGPCCPRWPWRYG